MLPNGDGPQMSLSKLLFSAIHSNDIGQLKRLCAISPKAKSVLLRQKDLFGSTALLASTAYGHWNISYFLLELGSDINACNDYGWTPLLTSIFHGQHTHFRYFLAHQDIDVNCCTVFGHTPLLIAVERRDLTMVYALLNRGANPNFRSSKSSADGLTPLMMACFKGDSQTVSALLNSGAEINAQNGLNMWTALMYAAARKDVELSTEIAQTLIDFGADIYARNRMGKTCIEIAFECDNEDFLGILNHQTDSLSNHSSRMSEGSRKKKYKRHVIFEAIDTKNRPLLLSLLAGDKHCLGVVDKSTGMTPLLYSIKKCDNTSAKMLLEYGANIEQPNFKTNMTPLMYAVMNHNLDIVKVLILRGANQHVKGRVQTGNSDELSSSTFTARDIAIINGYSDVLHLLSEDRRDSDSYQACQKTHLKSLNLMSKIRNGIEKIFNMKTSPSLFSSSSFSSRYFRLKRFDGVESNREAPDRSEFFHPNFNVKNDSPCKSPPIFSTGSRHCSNIISNSYPSLSKENNMNLKNHKDAEKTLILPGNELLSIQSQEELIELGIHNEEERMRIFISILNERERILQNHVNQIKANIVFGVSQP